METVEFQESNFKEVWTQITYSILYNINYYTKQFM